MQNKTKMKKTKNKTQKTLLALLSISLIVFMTFGILAVSEEIMPGPTPEQGFEIADKIPSPTLELEIVEYSSAYSISSKSSGTLERKATVSISLSPQRQATNDGTANYKVIVKDLHEPLCPATETEKGIVSCLGMNSYKYELKFKAREDGTTGSLDTETITLAGGVSVSIELKVKTENKGASSFTVTTSGEDDETVTMGTIVFLQDGAAIPTLTTDPANKRYFFNGQGFALNKDESQGLITDVKLLKKDDSLTGKVRIGQKNFRIQGRISDDKVEFELFSISSNPAISPNSNEEGVEDSYLEKRVIETFSGELQKYQDFTLLKGELKDAKGATWSLTAISKHGGIRPLIVKKTQAIAESISVSEVISIEAESVSEEVYIRPIEITRKKILRIIPNPWGKKVVSVEIIKGDKFSKTIIAENSNEIIEGYRVAIGSLESEEAIEFSVEKAE